jgi:hypothetical protein
MNIVAECLNRDSETEFLNDFPFFRLTSETLYGTDTQNSTKGIVTSFLRDSLANPSLSQENKPELTTPETCGRPQWNAFVSYNHDLHCSKMYQLSFPLDISTRLSANLIKAGMTVDGIVYPLQDSLISVRDTGSGYWLRPVARDYKGYTGRATKSICNQLREIFPETSGAPHPEFLEKVMGWCIGWSALKPLEMDKFQSWLQQHGEFLRESDDVS